MNAPVSLDDVLAGECLWAAAKASLSGVAILLVIALLGFVTSPLALMALPAIFLTGLCFAALGLIITALAPSYDFFMYYFTLFITPMTLLCGVFFPVEQLPAVVQSISAWLPLSLSVQLIRPLVFGELPANPFFSAGVLLVTTVMAFSIALVLTRRRLLK